MSPVEHYRRAEQLLAQLDRLTPGQLAYDGARIASQAAAHAALASAVSCVDQQAARCASGDVGDIVDHVGEGR